MYNNLNFKFYTFKIKFIICTSSSKGGPEDSGRVGGVRRLREEETVSVIAMPAKKNKKETEVLTQPSWRDTAHCWATTKSGKPCKKRACSLPESSGIPYCRRHMEVGDEAFEVVDHDVCPEIFGKILIARHEIPKNYRLVYWGKLCRNSELKSSAHDHMIEFCPNAYSDQSRGTIDPTVYSGSIAQYAATNGPGELITMTPEYASFGGWGKNRTKCAGRTYRFVRPLPKGMQVTHDYGSGWMECRGLKRLCVGTDRYPTLRRGQGGYTVKQKATRKRKKEESGKTKAKKKRKASTGAKRKSVLNTRTAKKRRKSAGRP